MLLWIARAWLLSVMAAQGVEQLQGTRSITAREFSAAFPGSKGWFSRLGSPDMSLHHLFGSWGTIGGRSYFLCLRACC